MSLPKFQSAFLSTVFLCSFFFILFSSSSEEEEVFDQVCLISVVNKHPSASITMYILVPGLILSSMDVLSMVSLCLKVSLVSSHHPKTCQ